MSPVPLALPPALPSELLTWILSHRSQPITLVICQSRARFLSSLQYSLAPSIQDRNDIQDPDPVLHPLLIPTLRQIATSRTVELVFIPTVSHLRAYSAVLDGRSQDQVVVYGLVELHRDTSEWSAQGLGTTIAGLVEARSRAVVLLEERKDEGNRGEPEAGDENDTVKVWDQRVPMLNGSVRRAGEDGGWSGRTVEVGRIISRWFKFGKRSWE